MIYWLYTWDYPDTEIEDEGLDMVEIGDAVTDDPKRVIAFLFDQRFW